MTDEILEYIRKRWPETTRTNTADDGTLLGLPRPYTVPCARDAFQELYYWDTYFACRGLALQGFVEQVRNNCDDFIFEVEKFGFIPNGNRTFYLNRSQPPFFGSLIELVIRSSAPDRAWLRSAAAALEKEMSFWNHSRRSECGLNHYGSDADEKTIREFFDGCCVRRIGYEPSLPEPERREASMESLAEAESGWDFNPRFCRRCRDYAAIDLNSLLHVSCSELSLLYRDLGDLDRSMEWAHRAEIRKILMNRYCWCEERGVFLDYNFAEKRHSPVLSCASLFPLWARIATPEQAASTLEAVERYLECEHGLAVCEKNESGRTYQWDWPNGWPPLHFIAIEALDHYGFTEAAVRIARKYVDTVTANFRSTGDLWEKYNVVTGTIEVKDEYTMPAMMGWTAGTFVFAADYLARH